MKTGTAMQILAEMKRAWKTHATCNRVYQSFILANRTAPRRRVDVAEVFAGSCVFTQRAVEHWQLRAAEPSDILFGNFDFRERADREKMKLAIKYLNPV